MTNHVLCVLGDITLSSWLSYSPTSHSFDLFARYNDLAKELFQADQGLFSQFKTTHVEETTKTASEVIEVLNEDSLLETTPEFSKVASILVVTPATSCWAKRLLSHCEQYCNNMGGLSLACLEGSCENIINVNRLKLSRFWTKRRRGTTEVNLSLFKLSTKQNVTF